MGNIVFLCGNNDTQLKTFLPVIRKLKETYCESCWIIPTARARLNEDILKNAKIPYFKNTISPPKRGYIPAIVFHLRYKKNINKIWKNLNAQILVVGNDTCANRYFLNQAKKSKIPSLLVQDGILTYNPDTVYNNSYRFRKGLLSIIKKLLRIEPCIEKYGEGKCTKIASWGHHSKEYFLKLGIPEDRILLTGSPRFDLIASTDWSNSADAIMMKLNIPQERKIVTFFSDFYEIGGAVRIKEKDFTIRNIVESARRLLVKNFPIHLVIKLHRAEKIAYFNSLYKTLSSPKWLTITQDVELYPLLYKTDVAITVASTVGLEALLFNKPLITVNFTGRPDIYNYAEKGGGIGVYNPDKLPSILQKTLFDAEFKKSLLNSQNKYIKDEVAYFDGRSTDRIADIIFQNVSRMNSISKSGEINV